MRVVVAMSGGVDSSVAAGLMVEAGHEVIGLTMKLRDTTPDEQRGQSGSCCSPDDLMDARYVCDTLGIPHYIVDYRDLFREKVIEPFAHSYLLGRTPNPCVACNDHVKFAPLVERAQALGADLLVTGHYAQIVEEGAGHWVLRQGVDPQKDQSYFLFGIQQDAMRMTRFPLGTLDKDAVRDKAREMGLPNWDKADSEDICFVPNGKYADVVEAVVGPERIPGSGPIVDHDGAVLGTHQGVHRYTVGQRRGLGVAASDRLYVLNVDHTSDTVTVGPRDALNVMGVRTTDCRWIQGVAPQDPIRARVKIRYRHAGVMASIIAEGSRALVTFDDVEAGVAPGQAAVFYDGDTVLGGGWIQSTIPTENAERRAQ